MTADRRNVGLTQDETEAISYGLELAWHEACDGGGPTDELHALRKRLRGRWSREEWAAYNRAVAERVPS